VLDAFDQRICRLAGSPFYNRRSSRVGWIDTLGGRVLWRAFDRDEAGESPTPEPVSAAVPRSGGGLVISLSDGLALADPDGTLRVLGTFAEADALAGIAPLAGPPADSLAGLPAEGEAGDPRPVVAGVDPAGRLFVGTHGAPGALYRLDPGGTVPRRVPVEVTAATGLAWSPEGATCYLADAALGRVDAFDYDPATGELAGRRPFVDFAHASGVSGPLGEPDGACVDAAGCLWLACWGGGRVLRFTAEGVLERAVPVPTPQVSACAFAGPDLDTLVVTTGAVGASAGQPGAGVVYRYRPGDVTGHPVGAYQG
jgi:sugar lactone lactonase YvrE